MSQMVVYEFPILAQILILAFLIISRYLILRMKMPRKLKYGVNKSLKYVIFIIKVNSEKAKTIQSQYRTCSITFIIKVNSRKI